MEGGLLALFLTTISIVFEAAGAVHSFHSRLILQWCMARASVQPSMLRMHLMCALQIRNVQRSDVDMSLLHAWFERFRPFHGSSSTRPFQRLQRPFH
eukprot:2425614-Lingulodinium_polyedra.AAC.1